jgi:hypothetical protein
MKKIKSLSALLVLTCILCSFGNDPFKDTTWIPKDFDGRNGVLLVEIIKLNIPDKQNDKQNEKAKELMQQLYPYKYEFATSEDIMNGSKYADKKKYRWALMYSSSTSTSTLTKGGTMPDQHGRDNITVSSSDFHVYDRQTNVHASPTGRSNSFILNIMRPTVATLTKFTQDKK